jgi:hypothetical protein
MLAKETQVKAVQFTEAPSLVPDRPIDFDQLGRMSHGHAKTMQELLRVFNLQADLLLARMTSEEPKIAAARAQVLASSARAVGAWKVAECAAAFEREARGNGPISLNPALRRLAAAVIEAQQATNGFIACRP